MPISPLRNANPGGPRPTAAAAPAGTARADSARGIGSQVAAAASFARGAAGEPLSPAQRAQLEKIYGPSVDYDRVRIVRGPPRLFRSLPRETPAFAVGNTIVVNPTSWPVTDRLLAHETAHVWQAQNHGMGYAVKALGAQLLGQAYDWEGGVAAGKRWTQLNPEQQAELIQDASAAGWFNDPSAKFVRNGVDYGDYLRNAQAQWRNSEGAPNWDFSRVRSAVSSTLGQIGRGIRSLFS